MKSFFAGFYVFEKCEAGKFVYQVDFGDKFFRVSEEYREFMEDAGIEIVQTWGWWVILRKAASEGKFELYTDVESSIEHYTKIRKMFKIVTVIELILWWIEAMGAAVGKNPAALAGVFILGGLIVGLLRITIRTTDIINSLKERQTGIPVEKKRNVSTVLALGLVLNGGAVMIRDSVSSGIYDAVRIFAIILMLAGIWDICRKKRK